MRGFPLQAFQLSRVLPYALIGPCHMRYMATNLKIGVHGWIVANGSLVQDRVFAESKR